MDGWIAVSRGFCNFGEIQAFSPFFVPDRQLYPGFVRNNYLQNAIFVAQIFTVGTVYTYIRAVFPVVFFSFRAWPMIFLSSCESLEIFLRLVCHLLIIMERSVDTRLHRRPRLSQLSSTNTQYYNSDLPTYLHQKNAFIR